MASEHREVPEDAAAQIAQLREQVQTLTQDRVTPAITETVYRDRVEGDEAGPHDDHAAERLHGEASGGREDADLKTWADQFDAKVDALTARQDAFLKYLELHARRR